MKDIFGQCLLDYWQGKYYPCFIRRDDGYIDKTDIGIYFTSYPQWQSCEKKVLKYAYGKVLDIGAGAGRHSLYLQNKGLEIHALDISPGAIKVMRKRGVGHTHLIDLRNLNKLEGPFDVILLMFNNIGLSGSIVGTKKLLNILYNISNPDCRIIATITNPYKTNKTEHLNYHKRNQKKGNLGGLVKIRKEYRGTIGDWFKIILMSPQELQKIIAFTGWEIAKIFEDSGATYGVVLEKIAESKIARRKHRH